MFCYCCTTTTIENYQHYFVHIFTLRTFKVEELNNILQKSIQSLKITIENFFIVIKMALGKFMEVFRSNCTGIGYWTHFLCGGVAGGIFVSSKKNSWMATFHVLFVLTLVGYQCLDYLYGEENMVSREFGLFRDLFEYFIGHGLVQLGAHLQKQHSSPRGERRSIRVQNTKEGLSNGALATIVAGSFTFDTIRVVLEVILPMYLLKVLQLDRSIISFLISCRFFGSFSGMLLTGPLTAVLSTKFMTSAGLALLGSIIGGLSLYRKDLSHFYLYVVMFTLGALASLVSVSLNTTVQTHGSADPTTANTIYRSFGLAAKLFIPSLASKILLMYETTSLDKDKNGAMVFLFRFLSLLAICGAVAVAVTSTSSTKSRIRKKSALT